MKRILVLSRGTVGSHMSSPGIRAFYMVQVLRDALPDAKITLAVPNPRNHPKIPGVRVTRYGAFWGLKLLAEHDIIISSGLSPHFAFFFRSKQFVADLFSQYFVEWMELTKSESKGKKQERWMNQNRAYLSMQLTFADFILCANERQRDTYVGSLSALGLIDPVSYDTDDTLRSHIDVAPHGVRPDRLKQERHVLKGKFAGIRETDKVLMWNGGIVAWYDPDTFIRAMAILAKERDDIKAVFLGTFYPDLSAFLGYGDRFQHAFQLAKDLGLYQSSVFFEFGWVPHRDVMDYLLDSDIGVCTYFDNLETRYSHRTRFLDIFWAELPLVCTRGDVLAEMVDERGLGVSVSEGDAQAVADAIRRLADDADYYQECRRNLQALKPELQWDVVFQPLIRFCKNGRSSAASKRHRFLPLLSRCAEYIAARIQHLLAPSR